MSEMSPQARVASDTRKRRHDDTEYKKGIQLKSYVYGFIPSSCRLDGIRPRMAGSVAMTSVWCHSGRKPGRLLVDTWPEEDREEPTGR